MIFLTSLYFHENTLVVEIYMNTYELRQNSVINMKYVAMATLNPRLPLKIALKTYGLPSQRPIIYERMLNYANYNDNVLSHTH